MSILSELIAFLDDLTSPTTAPQDDAIDYNPLDPIADQAIRRDIELVVEESRLLPAHRALPRRPAPRDEGAPEIGEIYPDRFRRPPFRRAQHADALGAVGMRAADRRPVHRQAALALSGRDDALPRLSRPGGRLGARGDEVPAHDLAQRRPLGALSAEAARAGGRVARGPGAAAGRPPAGARLLRGHRLLAGRARATATSARSSRSTRRPAGTLPTSATSRSRGCSRPCR